MKIYWVLSLLLSGWLIFQPGLVFGLNKTLTQTKEVTLNFNDVDLRTFIRFISKFTGQNFILDPRVKGKVTVLSAKPLQPAAVKKVFESVLEVNGFTLLDGPGATKIIPLSVAKFKGTPVGTKKGFSGEDKVITEVISLKYALASELRKILSPLISKQGVILAYSPSNVLILTDYASNLKKVKQVIELLDKPNSKLELNVIPLKFASAQKVANYLNRILTTRLSMAKILDLGLAIADQRLNVIILLTSKACTLKIKNLVAQLDQPTRKINRVHVIRLKNAKAENIAKVLTNLVEQNLVKVNKTSKSNDSRFSSSKIKIVANQPTNSLIITAEPDEFAVLEQIVSKLDVPRKQVFIQSAILEVSESAISSFGINWNFAGQKNVLHMDKDVMGFVGSNPNSGFNLFNQDQLVPPSGLSLGVISFPFIFNGHTVYNFASLINLAKSNTNFNVISYPQIMTLENEEAKIVVADNIPFATKIDKLSSGDDVVQNIEYKDVGVTLKVIPQVNEQGWVRLKIFQEVSRIINQVVSDQTSRIVAIAPTTKRRLAETTIEVKSGETIVIAGLVESGKENTNQGVPWLSDLPGLGWLFKAKNQKKNQTNLMVFITPYVVEDVKGARAISSQKMEFLDVIRFGSTGHAGPLPKSYLWATPPNW